MVLTEHRAFGLGEVRIEVSTVLPLERAGHWPIALLKERSWGSLCSLQGPVFRGRHPPPALLKMGILPRPPDSEPSQRCHDSNSWMCFAGPGQALVTTPPGPTKGSFVGGSSCSQSVEDGWLPGLQHFLLEPAPPPHSPTILFWTVWDWSEIMGRLINLQRQGRAGQGRQPPNTPASGEHNGPCVGATAQGICVQWPLQHCSAAPGHPPYDLPTVGSCYKDQP